MNEPPYAIVVYPSAATQSRPSLTLAELSRLTGLDRSLLRRFAFFAVIDSYADRGGTLRFPISELPRLARGVRLRRHLGVSVPSLGLVLDLLERVDSLESELERLKKIGTTGTA